jgi:hypothetical protein
MQVAKPFPKGFCKHFKHWRVPIILHGTAFQDPRKLVAGEQGFAEPAFGAISRHHIHDLLSNGRAVAAEAGDSGIGRLLQEPAGAGYICPQ